MVKPSFLQRATVWLCLAVAVLTGLTPARGFVLCLEPDGDLCIEVATSAATCSSCIEEVHDATPTQVVPAHAPSCSCLDLPVPGFSQDRQILPRATVFQLEPWVAVPSTPFATRIVSHPTVVREPRFEVPRAAESLARIRSVVLHI